ncbi:MAG: hypothetical protein ACKVOA_10345 [Methylophilaceae bacterium]
MENINSNQAKQPATWLQVIRSISLRLLGIHSKKNKEDAAHITVGQAFVGGVIGVIIFMVFVGVMVSIAINHFS